MKAVTWNVNSIAVRGERLKALLEREAPDVVCLQELKCVEEKFPFDLVRQAGYHAAVSGQKTYNGVAILSKAEPQAVMKALPGDPEDAAARFIAATIDGVRVHSLYIPNGKEVGAPSYEYKLKWLGRLRDYLKSIDSAIPQLLLGDFNIAPEERDVHDPGRWNGKILCSDAERAAIREIYELGFEDTFRLHEKAGGFYSWWDYRMGAFHRGWGLRIDFVLANAALAKRCKSAFIDRNERRGEKPSDHAPVGAIFGN